MKLISAEEIIEFEKQQQDLDNQITNLYEQGDDANVLPMFDGVVNPINYFNSNPKILWILKEPYDGEDEFGNPNGGDMDNNKYRNALNEKLNLYRPIPTWKRIAYTSFGIINDCLYDDMDNIVMDQNKDCSVFESIKSIAFVNIKKTPGRTSSTYSDIRDAYQISRETLLKQIQLFRPEVIIGGGTLTFFMNDLDLASFKKEGHGLKYFIKNNMLYIDASHPSYPKGEAREEEYVDEIISVYRDYKKLLSK